MNVKTISTTLALVIGLTSAAGVHAHRAWMHG